MQNVKNTNGNSNNNDNSNDTCNNDRIFDFLQNFQSNVIDKLNGVCFCLFFSYFNLYLCESWTCVEFAFDVIIVDCILLLRKDTSKNGCTFVSCLQVKFNEYN